MMALWVRLCRAPRHPGWFCVGLIVVIVGCSRVGPDRPVSADLGLADFVPHQRFNVTTQVVSAQIEDSLQLLEYGWQVHPENEGLGPRITVTESVARLGFFSAGGDLHLINLQMALEGESEPAALPLVVRLNGRRLGRAEVGTVSAPFGFEVPPDLVRVGANYLELQPRLPATFRDREDRPAVAVESIRFLRRKDTPGAAASWRTIRVEDSEASESARRTVVMPASSFLDMVLEVPLGARFQATVQIETGPGKGDQPVTCEIHILDSKGQESALWSAPVGTSRRDRFVDLDLEAWQGDLVRLRLRVEGPDQALVRWTAAGIRAESPGVKWTPFHSIARSQPERSAVLGRPDVVIIVLDAARADAFSPFGGPYPSPALERLAADGTVFEQAIATSPWTGQSMAAILTGLFADTLGVGPWTSRVPDDIDTMAQMMSAAGYRSLLWTQHPFYKNHTSFRKGFSEFLQGPRGDFAALLPRERLLPTDGKGFTLLHLIPPHAPYEPPANFRGRYSSWYEGSITAEAPFLNSFPQRRDPREVSPEDLRYIQDRYRENAAFADHLVGNILDDLQELGRYGGSLVIVVSDHGEGFLEHERFLHTRRVHREFLHVPLIVKWPSTIESFPPRIDSPVSLVDLVPTLVDGLDLPARGAGFQGQSLIPLIAGEPPLRRAIYAITRGVADRKQLPRPEHLLEMDGWRILHSPVAAESLLFAGEADPSESEDLAADNPLLTLWFRQSVEMQNAWNVSALADETSMEVEELDPDVVEQLEALGYIE